jgi:hypothetical protein
VNREKVYLDNAAMSLRDALKLLSGPRLLLVMRLMVMSRVILHLIVRMLGLGIILMLFVRLSEH